MREITVKSIGNKGGAVVNGGLGIPSGVAAVGMAQAGWDSPTADLQHGSGAMREGNVTGAKSAGGSMY